MTLKLMTYNIAGGRDYSLDPVKAPYHIEGCTEEIRRRQPDIVGLNEVDYEFPRSNRDRMAERLAGALHMNYAFAPALQLEEGGKLIRAREPGKGNYGNALLSRYPIISAETLLIPDAENAPHPESRSVLSAKISVEGRILRVLVTHFGLSKEEQEQAVAFLLPILSASKGPTVLMGDLNCEPDGAHLAPLFSALRDTYPFAEEKTHTYPSGPEVNGGKPPVKIDYLFVSEELRPVSVRIGTDARSSDHFPYIALCEM